jgi:hypothetical protein
MNEMTNMKGYTNLKQYIDDFKLYKMALENERTDREETLASVLKNRMKQKLNASPKRFKEFMNKKRFTEFDMILITVHEEKNALFEVTDFTFDVPPRSREHYTKLKKIIKSAAFKEGMLYNLEKLLPKRMDCKEDLVEFVRDNPHMSHSELCVVCSCLTRKDWKSWLREAQDEKLVTHRRRGWQ